MNINRNASKKLLGGLLALGLAAGLLVHPVRAAGDTTPFDDVSPSDWFCPAVTAVYQEGLMQGTGPAAFSPYGSATRSMPAMVLYRLAGSPGVSGAGGFSDVSDGDWYSAAAAWAAEAGVYSGYPDGSFGPNLPVTREQLMVVFYRFAQYSGWDTALSQEADGVLDQVQVSDWAREAAAWAISSGTFPIREGAEDLRQTATRAEIAAMLYGVMDQGGALTRGSLRTSQMDSFSYLLYTPENAAPGMPLIVYLHGGSGRGDDLGLLTGEDGFPKYIQDGSLGSVPAYVVMPQLPSGWKGWTDVEASLKELISAIQREYGVDGAKVSLTGHSMGGTGAWGVAIDCPDLFFRVAPLSGSVRDSEAARAALANLPVWALVGERDTIVDPSSSIQMVDELAAQGREAKLTVFDGASHFDVPSLAYLDQDLGLIDWLLGGG